MHSSESEFESFITSSLQEASKIALDKFGKVTGSTKPEDNNQVLTEADLAIGSFLIKQIRQKFPDHNIIDEEAGVVDKGSNFTWVIDPIDGTSNFANSSPNYVVMLGLLKNERPFAGGIIAPAFGDLYFAQKEKGAVKNGKSIYVTTEKNLLSTLVAYQIDSHREDPQITKDECLKLADIVLEIRNLRASGSVLDGCMVADGRYGAYLGRSSKIWDNVAHQIIIEEAEGKYTDFFGKEIDYRDALKRTDENFTWCAASPILHEQLQKIISNF